MKPLKFATVIEATAQRSGQSSKAVDAVLRLYFKDVRTALTTLAHPRVQIHNLGTFCLKPYTLEKKWMRRQALLDAPSQQPERQVARQEELLAEMKQVALLLQKIQEEKERKEVVKARRKEKE
jgi:hypothetical protein